jgi:hypothetical protein
MPGLLGNLVSLASIKAAVVAQEEVVLGLINTLKLKPSKTLSDGSAQRTQNVCLVSGIEVHSSENTRQSSLSGIEEEALQVVARMSRDLKTPLVKELRSTTMKDSLVPVLPPMSNNRGDF